MCVVATQGLIFPLADRPARQCPAGLAFTRAVETITCVSQTPTEILVSGRGPVRLWFPRGSHDGRRERPRARTAFVALTCVILRARARRGRGVGGMKGRWGLCRVRLLRRRAPLGLPSHASQPTNPISVTTSKYSSTHTIHANRTAVAYSLLLEAIHAGDRPHRGRELGASYRPGHRGRRLARAGRERVGEVPDVGVVDRAEDLRREGKG